MSEYKYEKETLEIYNIVKDIETLNKKIEALSLEIQTDDMDELIKEATKCDKAAERVLSHLSSLNTKEDIRAYIAKQQEMASAKKVAKLLERCNVLEFISMNRAGITGSDIVNFQNFYNVRLRESGYGTWRWLSLYDTEGNCLETEDLYKYGIREEKSHNEEISEEEIQKVVKETATKDKEPKSHHLYADYGWVLTNGDFVQSGYGTHEETARTITKQHGLEEEYAKSEYHLYRDFLVYDKGYVLIHNPMMDGGYIVTRSEKKRLTKAQKKTLYDYFVYNNDTFMANQYVD